VDSDEKKVPEPSSARPAAVLILLYPRENQWFLPLILRPEDIFPHAGQISLPGGAIEPGETSREAAVREFHEELGSPGLKIELLGMLSPWYVQASNYLVHPWVGACTNRPDFIPNSMEVQELLEVPLDHLLDPDHFGSHPRQRHGKTYNAPHFAWKNHRIWGATCMILGEFVIVVEEIGGNKS
jgi:8-oxo-dGTP pyrophosphatase MutT (NUDIX family)